MPACCCAAQVRERASCAAWLLWALWCSLAVAPAWGYVIVNSVSWSVPNEVEEEMDSSSNEEVLPALLEDTTSLWKQSYPASVYKEEEEMRSRPSPGKSKPLSSPSRMFSYRRAGAKGAESLAPQEQAARTARFLVHDNDWGFLATKSTQEKMQGAPFGNFLSISDGPTDNSTGTPFFYVTPKGTTVVDLMKNSIASLTLPEAEGDFCRKTIVDPDDPRCARLILTGQMVTVPPEEIEFAKQALFSRHPVMRKWPRSYEWFFMKMNIELVWLQNWYGGITTIAPEEYFRAVPSKT
ncbi:protein CREG2 [Eublepharis macularius]|uniref:Protein CREG2 n=1 Tax=Eublepharis macularius TaxID=481883 RepID=A0AA97J2R1_EUBMA|nr:protein CREG2 [Eublepharis macularius]